MADVEGLTSAQGCATMASMATDRIPIPPISDEWMTGIPGAVVDAEDPCDIEWYPTWDPEGKATRLAVRSKGARWWDCRTRQTGNAYYGFEFVVGNPWFAARLRDYAEDDQYPYRKTIPSLTAAIAFALHELMEGFQVDGERVFDPHPEGGDDLGFLMEVAERAAIEIAARHPR